MNIIIGVIMCVVAAWVTIKCDTDTGDWADWAADKNHDSVCNTSPLQYFIKTVYGVGIVVMALSVLLALYGTTQYFTSVS